MPSLDPRRLLARAMARALSERFVDVDPDSIELSLLRSDGEGGGRKSNKTSGVELRDVSLRPVTVPLPGRGSRGTGRAVVQITGTVRSLSFDWSWSFAPSLYSRWRYGKEQVEGREGWIRDARLALSGVRFYGNIIYDDAVDGDGMNGDVGESKGDTTLSSMGQKPEETDSEDESDDQAGFVKGYIQKEVERILDAVTIHMEDFWFELELPSEDDTGNNNRKESLVVGGEVIEIASLGRHDGGREARREDNNILEGGEDAVEVASIGGEGQSKAGRDGVQEEDGDDEPAEGDASVGSGWTVWGALTGAWSYFGTSSGNGVKPDMDAINRGRVSIVGIYADICSKRSTDTRRRRSKRSIRGFQILRTSRDSSSRKRLQNGGNTERFEVTAHSMIESFAYTVDIALEGKRWQRGDFGTGVSIVGIPSTDASHLAVSAGNLQIGCITRLLSFLLAPDGDAEGANGTSGIDGADKGKEDSDAAELLARDEEASKCILRLPVITVHLLDFLRFSLSSVTVLYRLDGKELTVNVEGFCLGGLLDESRKDYDMPDLSVSARGLSLCLAPKIELRADTVDDVYMADSFQLTQPMENQKVTLEGGTLVIDVPSIEGRVPGDDEGRECQRVVSSTAWVSVSSQGSQRGPVFVPFPGEYLPCHFFVHKFLLADSEGVDEICIEGAELCIYPNQSSNDAQVGLKIKALKTKPLQLNEAKIFALLPFGHSNIVRHLCFAAKSAIATAGFSTNEWTKNALRKGKPVTWTKDAFERRSKFSCFCRKNNSEASDLNSIHHESPSVQCPNASIAELDLHIAAVDGTVEVKETRLVTPPFVGNESTTFKDIATFYTSWILKKVPGFLSNAEVLGVDVRYAAVVPFAFAGPFVPIVVAAVDGVQAAVEAKKRINKSLDIHDFIRTERQIDGDETRRSAILYDANHSFRTNLEKTTSRPGFLCCAVSVGCIGGPIGGAAGLVTALVIRLAAKKKTQDKVKEAAVGTATKGTQMAKGVRRQAEEAYK